MEAFAYEPNVLVLDVELDEEPEMQVYGDDDGCWHRRAIGERTTACGEDIERGAQLRHNSYDGRLCRRGCFTTFELGIHALGSHPIPTIRKDDSDG